MAVGAKLKRLRLKKGESLQDVADAVRASKAHIWELETGKSRNPSLDLLTRLSDHFSVSLSQLVGEAPEEEADQELMVLFRNLKELDEDDKELLKDIIDKMRKRERGRGAKK
jgi:transcriptional regulator with XRE-family HTH domain